MAREYKDSGIEWIGQIPKEWEVVRTKNVFSLGKDLVGNNSSQTQLLSLTTKGIKKVSVGSTSGKVPNSYDSYHDKYLFCVLKAVRYYWMKYAVGTRKDPNISQEIVRNMLVPMPPFEEQQSIASYLDTKCSEIDALIAIKQAKIDELKDYKKSIIYEYVTGKKEVV